MLQLYHSGLTTCSKQVRHCLREKGLPYESKYVELWRYENLSPDYLKLNPNGVVPTLVHDGNVICDSSVICEYLDEVFPEPALAPRDPVGRAHLRTWLRFVEEVPTAATRVPTFQMALQPFRGVDPDTFRTERADVRPLRKHFYRRMGPNGFAGEEIAASLDELTLAIRRMDDALARHPWIIGERFSLADVVVAPTIDRLDDLGLASLWTDHPRVSDWYARLKARPSYAAAFYPGARMSARFPKHFKSAQELQQTRGY